MKRLRLNQARLLMLMQHLDATSAAAQVGHEAPPSAVALYSRVFVASPIRDIKNIGAASAHLCATSDRQRSTHDIHPTPASDLLRSSARGSIKDIVLQANTSTIGFVGSSRRS